MFEITKLDAEGCLVFGFANVSVSKRTAAGVGGECFEDLQGDKIPPDDLEEAAYEHVLEFRAADEMHTNTIKGQLVESMVFTPDKLEKFATDPATGQVIQSDLDVLKRIFPPRWWVGYKLDKSLFDDVKSGKYTMFSIGGEAEAVEV